MANKCMKRCLTPLIIREMEIKTTSYQFTPSRMAVIQKSDNNISVDEDMTKHLHTLLVGK